MSFLVASCSSKLDEGEGLLLEVGMTKSEVHEILSDDPYSNYSSYTKNEKYEVEISDEYFYIEGNMDKMRLSYRNDSLTLVHLY